TCRILLTVIACSALRNSACGHASLALLALTLTLAAARADLHVCEGSFFERAPPAHVALSGLKTECHALADGRTFATLHDPGCGATIYTAFHLSPSNGWGKGVAQEGVRPSAFLVSFADTPPALASPLQKMDSLSAEVVESKVIPLCSKTGGDVYVQTGVGGLNKCQTGAAWTAACCAVPEGSGSFSVGIMQGEGKELQTVSVKELEEWVGVQELFSGGCGESGGQGEEEVDSFLRESLDSSCQDLPLAEESEEQAASHAAMLGDEPDPEETSESDDGGILLYVLSSVASLLCSPFFAVASAFADLLSQVAYVLQEDAAVLAAVPGDGLALTQSLASGVASGVEGAWDVMYCVGATGAGSVYACASALGGILLLSFQEGLAGMATLACDALGLATGTLERGWDVGGAVVGWAGQQVGEYLGTVGSELMQQTVTVGDGMGTLAWRGQRGMCHLLQALGGIMGGLLENTVGNVQEAFGGE
uniref:INO80 complex subunit E n=1 Tax=Electrophorus electricus TaxID=8005 RepID=A0A4W4E016_ELEEL